ncbi:MAG TPA: formyltetrahydrofolate deformylase [Rhizomicrobium sp.]
MSEHADRFILTLSCKDRMGIVADVSHFLFEHRCNIVDSAQFGDPDNGLFFMRTSFQAQAPLAPSRLEADFRPIREKFGMNAALHVQGAKLPTLVLVSKFGHCLNDLLYRHRIGALPVDIRAIVSNHPDFTDVAATAKIPFHFLPVTAATKAAQEAALLAVAREQKVELIVLARYMQVLSPELCAEYSGRIINIHHSFLPSFKGARPYQQAHERGVKLIGATAHYVTGNLDEGPIIEQAVERVTHSFSVEDMVAAGRDLESVVLARAVKWHAEQRILLNGGRTVIFR